MADRPSIFEQSPVLSAALGYAARGWPVHPCSPQTKAPLLPNDIDAAGKKIPKTGGVKKGSTDLDQIRAWWKRWPKALVGVATGHSRLFVLDFDPRTDPDTGEVFTLERLKADVEAQMGCALPRSLTSITQSGGVHVWLCWPDDGGPAITNRGNLPLHVDVRGLGGYVIAPPSIMSSGKAYRWHGDADGAIVEAPPELVAILRAPGPAKAARAAATDAPAVPLRKDGAPEAWRSSDDPVDATRRKWALSALDSQLSALARAVTGQRGSELNRVGFMLGQLVGAGVLTRSMVVAGLESAVSANGLAGTDGVDRVRENIYRAIRDGEAQPRDMSDVGALAGRTVARDRPPAHDAVPNGAPMGRRGEDVSFRTEAILPLSVGGRGDRIRVEPDPERDRACAFLPLTDLGNAERFRVRFGHRFHFCPDLGWFMWDGRRWALLNEEKDKLPGEVMQAVFRTVRAIRNEARLVEESGVRDHEPHDQGEPDPDGRMDFIVKATKNTVTMFSDTIAAHAKSSEGANRLKSIAGLVKDFAGTLVRADQFDRDRDAINVMNGTIRVVSDGNGPVITLSPHNPADMITKIAAVTYDPAATCPTYDAFFLRVMPDEADRRFLHQWAGLSSTGDITYHKMAFFWGKGRNGKSTWVDTVATILGEYAMTIKFDTFLEQSNKRKGSDATPDLARLPGVRFLRASEPEKGAKLAEALIKEVTGGEMISARHLNKGFFDYLPSFKFTAQGNYQPKITGHDDGIWGRVRLVPWPVRIPDSEIDQTLPAKLKAERSGIFNRMMAGLIDLKTNGLVESGNIKAATQKYREASDQLGRFLRDCTADQEGNRVRSGELFALFTAWAKASGSGEWSTQGFAKAMEDRGYSRVTSNGVWWVDLKATVDVADIEAGRFGAVEDVAPSPPSHRLDDGDFVPGFD